MAIYLLSPSNKPNQPFLMQIKQSLKRVWLLYYDGFRSMTVGRTLWVIILLKLFVMFIILKLLFFPNFLKKEFSTDELRSDYIIEQLTEN